MFSENEYRGPQQVASRGEGCVHRLLGKESHSGIVVVRGWPKQTEEMARGS